MLNFRPTIPHTMNPLLAVGLLFAGVLVFSRFATADTATRLKFVLKSINFNNNGLLQIQINITIGIQNPTSNGFTIHSLAGDLYVNDYHFGNISNFTPTTIPANSETPYTISLLLDTLSLPGTILDIIRDFRGIIVRVDAQANVDDLNLPVQIKKSF